MNKILDFPELRQTYNYDCGASALQSVLVYYGVEEKEGNLFQKLETSENDFNLVGAKLYKIIEVAQSYGLDAKLIDNGNIQFIIDNINKGIPVILLIQAWKEDDNIDWTTDFEDGHYVVAIGYTDDKIIFEDPADFHRNFIYKDDLLDRWHAYDDDDKLSYKHYAIIIEGTPKYKKNKISAMETLTKLIDKKINEILNESPDTISIPKEYIKLNFSNSDALAFTYRDGKVYISDFKGMHFEIEKQDKLWKSVYPTQYSDRDKKYIEGRLWKDNKIISFWTAPLPNKMKQFIVDLNSALKRRTVADEKFNFKVDLNWKLDVQTTAADINADDYYTEYVVKIKDYIKQDFLTSLVKPSFANTMMEVPSKTNKR